jgi:hypothetical protein
MAKKSSIPNWTMFGAHTVTVEIHEMGLDDDDNPLYQAAYGFFLDDGQYTLEEAIELDTDKKKHISIFLDQFDNDPDVLAVRVAAFATGLFDTLGSTAFIFEDNNETPRELNLEELIEDIKPANLSSSLH